MLSRRKGGPCIGRGFGSNCLSLVGTLGHLSRLFKQILLKVSDFLDQFLVVGHLNRKSQLSSNASPMHGLPPPCSLTFDRCIILTGSKMVGICGSVDLPLVIYQQVGGGGGGG